MRVNQAIADARKADPLREAVEAAAEATKKKLTLEGEGRAAATKAELTAKADGLESIATKIHGTPGGNEIMRMETLKETLGPKSTVVLTGGGGHLVNDVLGVLVAGRELLEQRREQAADTPTTTAEPEEETEGGETPPTAPTPPPSGSPS